MKLVVFVRMHARSNAAHEVENAIREVLGPSRQEPGCLAIDGFRSIRDARLFFIHSQWTDEEAFELHATLPHTQQFVERVDSLLDQPREVARTVLIA